jgi:ribonuclease Y
MTLVFVVLAVLFVAIGIAALLAPRLRRSGTAPAPGRVSLTTTEANLQGAALVAEARAAALRAREASLDELNERRAAVESRDALITDRDRRIQERRDAFNDRRFAFKKRREEIEARQAAVVAAREDIGQAIVRSANLERDDAVAMVLERVDAELSAEHAGRVEQTVAELVGDTDADAANRIIEAIQRQDTSNVDDAPRIAPLSLERLDAHGRERLLSALALIAENTGTELGVDEEKAQATLRGVDPIGREIARQAAIEVVDRHLQANDVPPLLQRTRRSTSHRVVELGERALWQMQMEGRPELAELVGTLHFRFSYGQNALLHCQETGYLCSVLAAELGLAHATARDAGMLHDIGKAVDHDVEGVHAIIGGELLTVLGADPAIVHAVKAHHFDEEPSTDLAMLTICADAISASRPGARRDTLAAYLARLEQLQAIATRHPGVDRAFPLQAGREVRIFVKASQVKDADMPPLTAEIAREIEAEMQYPGIVKVTVIRETTATATAPAQITPVRRGSAEPVAVRQEAAPEEPPAGS